MISGADLRLLCLVLLLACAPAAYAQSWGLPDLMQSLAQVHSASAAFTARQTSPVLSAPLISTGTLTYTAPGYLRKTTSAPTPEDFILNGEKITLTSAQAGGTRVFNINQDPRIAGLVEGIRGTLAGDLPQLETFYNVSLSGGADNWQLTLLPKPAALAKFLRSITITGHQSTLDTIDTATADGGDSRMSIRPAQNAP
jgi:outer membrane lipoprotein-sorting protein